MTITEKAAYLKGLVEGQGMDPEAGEGKLWNVLSELVGDLAAELKELREDQEDLADSVENVEISVEYLEDLLQDDFEEFDDDDDEEEDGVYPFAGPRYKGDDEDDLDDLPEADAQEDDDEDDEGFGVFYEAECPSCGEVIEFEDDVLESGSVRCPNCGALLEFDLDADSDEDSAQKNPELADVPGERENKTD